MKKTFIEMKIFQVKPDKLEQFEAKIEEMTANQFKCEGCISLKYFKRFYKDLQKMLISPFDINLGYSV